MTMVFETHKPMKCPDCGEDVKLIQVDDFYGREECVVDPKPVSSSNAGLTYQEHACDKKQENQDGGETISSQAWVAGTPK